MSLSVNFPSVAPSLNLDFAGSERLDPRITFTRATTARYYDGVTTAKAEENLLLQSQALATSPWGANNATVTNNTGDTTAPDGTSTATKIALNATSGVAKWVRQDVASLSNVVVSFHAKQGTHSIIQIYAEGNTGNYCNFDLSSGTVGNAGANASGSIVSLANSWYRCIVVFGSTAGGRTYIAAVDSTTALFGATTTAVSVDFYAWGAQREQRSAVTAYTPTTTQPITNYIPVLLTAAAGVARFDHTPTTGTSLGLLVEEQRTNLLTYSEQFDNAAWTKTNVTVTTNQAVAPDGTLSADLIVPTTDNDTHRIRQDSSLTSGTSYSNSIYFKAAGYNWIWIQLSTGFDAAGQLYRNVNIGDGTLGTGTLGTNDVTVTFVGNGWYRVNITRAATSTTTGRINWAIRDSDGATAAFAGDGYKGVFAFGAQLEAGAFPTSYIPTVASSVTRNADVASMTGTNFSSWYNQSEMTFYGEYAPIYTASASVPTNTPHLLQADFTASSNNNYAVRGAVNSQSQEFVARSVAAGAQFPFVGSIGFLQAGVFRKVAYGINSTQLAPVANGIAGSVITNNVASTMSTPDRFTIGSGTGGAPPYQLNGHIRRIAYYPTRLTNEQLQALTR